MIKFSLPTTYLYPEHIRLYSTISTHLSSQQTQFFLTKKYVSVKFLICFLLYVNMNVIHFSYFFSLLIFKIFRAKDEE